MGHTFYPLFRGLLGTKPRWQSGKESTRTGTEAKKCGGVGPGRESAFSYKTAASGEAMAISSVNVGIIPSDLSGKPIPLSVKMGLPLGVCCYSVALCVPFFAAPSTAARQASLSFAISQSLLTLMFIELVMPSNHLILCRLLLLPSIFPSVATWGGEADSTGG